MHPVDFTATALMSRLQKAFLPMWLVDGFIEASWNALVGFDYQVASSTESFAGGLWSTNHVTETRVKWEPRTGRLQRDYRNLAVPALENHDRFFAGLGSYPLQEAVPYNTLAIAQAAFQVPDLSTEQAWPLARTQFDRAAARDCQIACDAQHIDQVNLQAEYQKLNWTLLLLPIYYTNYHDDQGMLHTVMVNGHDGHIFGMRRASQSQGWRWTGTLAGIGLACLLLTILQSLVIPANPVVAAISTILFILGALITIISPMPAIWAWQFNRNPQE
ncbi:MAG: hypothetical protein PHQ40_08220 [Anaerolineaceae bacterium]|nr:hypothetical protein [Anaerolineaceae bacterium]